MLRDETVMILNDTIWWSLCQQSVQWIGFKRVFHELELAKYDFITIADWYQVAIENPNRHLGGTDSLQYGNQWWDSMQSSEIPW